ncbi:hypothetical protein H0X32_01100 [Patescibacteria group bacterium]|nr:hypothetical protein [Patescibacteria group bacterium]
MEQKETKHSEARFGMWQSWSSWSSPVGLGVFFLTTALALAVVLYALLSLVGAVLQATRPVDNGQALTQQELQQALQQQVQPSGTNPTGTILGQ